MAAFLLPVAAGAVGLGHWHLTNKYRATAHPNPATRRARLPPARTDDTDAEVYGVAVDAGVELYVRRWPAKTDTYNGCVFMVHGYTWHSKYFEAVAKHLNMAGFTVIAHDLPAHGLSGSMFGIRGYHTPLESYLDGIAAVVDHAQQNQLCNPNTDVDGNGNDVKAKLFLYGESFGGTLVLHTLLHHPDLADRLAGVITAGVVMGRPEVLPPAPVLMAVKRIAHLYPLLPMPEDDITKPEKYVQAFGDEQLARTALEHDHLLVRQTRMGMMHCLLPALDALEARLPEIRSPLLILHGLADVRVSPEKSRLLHRKASSVDIELHMYPGCRHQLMQESAENQPRIWNDMLTWLTQRS